MIRPSSKQLLSIVIFLIVVGVSAFLLAADPLRTEPITSTLEASHDRPRPVRTTITWTPTSVETIVSPNETVSTTVSFVSSKNIRRAEVQVSQELVGILRPEPAVLQRVRKGEQRTIQLVVSPSAATALGTYAGTIQIVRGKADKDDDDDDDDYDRDERGKPLAQSLPVVVNVWQTLDTPNLRFNVKFPPGWTANQGDNVVAFVPPGVSPQEVNEFTGDVVIFVDLNASALTIQQYYDGHNNQALFQDSDTVEQLAVGGRPAYRFGGVKGMSSGDTVIVVLSDRFVRIEGYGSPAVFESIVSSLKAN